MIVYSTYYVRLPLPPVSLQFILQGGPALSALRDRHVNSPSFLGPHYSVFLYEFIKYLFAEFTLSHAFWGCVFARSIFALKVSQC